MAKPMMAIKKAKALSAALFLIGLAILFFIDQWWPLVMIVIGIPLALRQFLLGRFNDAAVSFFVFVGFFVIAQFDISWKVLVPIIFIMAAVYILCKEWVLASTDTDAENEESADKKD